MIRGLFKLAIFLLLAHALFRFVPPYWHHTRFESELDERLVTWREDTDDEVRERVLAMAQKRGLPVRREQITVRREREYLFVDVLYTRRIELIPSWRYDWTFESNVDAMMLQSPGRTR